MRLVSCRLVNEGIHKHLLEGQVRYLNSRALKLGLLPTKEGAESVRRGAVPAGSWPHQIIVLQEENPHAQGVNHRR
jgi:hypothetical protein